MSPSSEITADETGAAPTRAPTRIASRPGVLQKRARLMWYLFLAPALILLLAFMVLPIIRGLNLSLYEWKGLGVPKWVGLDNFEKLLGDRYFWLALRNTVVFAIAATIGQVGLGLLLALALARRVRFHQIYRVAFYLPVMLPAVAAAALWFRILEGNAGLLNSLLETLGLGFLAHPWLGSIDLALPSLIAVSIWLHAGFAMIVLLAAIEGIPPELHDAASIDGTNEWHRVRYLIVPMIWPVLVSISAITLIGSLKVFDLVWIMTKGGPSSSTSVLGTYLFKLGFQQQHYGYASAVATVMFVIIFAVTYVYYLLTKIEAVEY